MNSAHPKVCCEVLRKPMLSWVLNTCEDMGIQAENLCVVLSDNPGKAKNLIPESVCIATQIKRLGTGHAVLTAMPFLKRISDQGARDVCILYGDVPFADAGIMSRALAQHHEENRLVTVLSAILPDGGRYGRIIRENGQPARIVEAADATPQELSVCEINAGIYWIDIAFLMKALPCLTDQNAQGEIYLTDLVGLAKTFGGSAGAFVCSDADAMLGANTRKELAALNEIARARVFERLYAGGVDIPQTDGVLIGPDVTIGRDTLVLPGTVITGKSEIGSDCVMGPASTINDCAIKDGSTIEYAHLNQCKIGCRVRVGPFSRINPGGVIADDAVVGSYAEI